MELHQISGRPRKMTLPLPGTESDGDSGHGTRLTFEESHMLTLQYTKRKMWGTLRRALTAEDSEEVDGDINVRSYYHDESDLTMAIPPNLQVTESKWTLQFQYEGRRGKSILHENEDELNDKPWELEKIFIKERFKKSRRLVRISIMSVLFLAIIAAVVAYYPLFEGLYLDSESARTEKTQVLCGVLVPFSLIWCLATFTKFYEDNLTWLPSMFVFIIGGCLLYTTYIGHQPDSAIYMIYLFFVWLFIRIPYWTLLMVTSVMFVVYIFVIRFTVLYDDKYILELVEILYLLGTNICLAFATYCWERTDRVEFLDAQTKNYIQNNTKDLLNQILPTTVQERVYTRDTGGFVGKPIADEERDVSVLFSDIKGFTKFCSGVKAIEVVKQLNTLYMTFDESLKKLDVYKVETIGDAYFVSANCPIKIKDHARRLVILGKEMIDACSKFPKGREDKFQMRIGVHTGPVFAGVVGRKMPRYHLFGRTVTIAESLESSGKPGKVQISEVTKKYLEDWEKDSKSKLNFNWIPRGSMEVINEVFLETYFVKFDVEMHIVA